MQIRQKIAILSFLILTQPSAGQVTGIEAPGNLEATTDLGCVGGDALSSLITPADLYPALAKCVTDGRFENAVTLYGVAQAYGAFDAQRMLDPTARQAISALQATHLWSLPQERREAFAAHFESVSAPGSPVHNQLCSLLRKLGAPTYEPSYMIQHGLGALSGEPQGVKPIDREAVWDSVLADYMMCS